MRRFDVKAFYELARTLAVLRQWPDGDLPLRAILFPGFRAMTAVRSRLLTWPPEMKASRMAAHQVILALGAAGVPQDADDLDTLDYTSPVDGWRIGEIKRTVNELETVLLNDMPGLAVWYVSPKGIYSTDGLVGSAFTHLISKPDDMEASVRVFTLLPKLAQEDINESGRALAFELPTASAFHLWRAVETVMGDYYKVLTSGRSFEDDGIQRNWGSYVSALEKANAENKITNLLNHIRVEYRNPTMHPDETVTLDEAFALFGAGLSVIGQTLRVLPMPGPSTP